MKRPAVPTVVQEISTEQDMIRSIVTSAILGVALTACGQPGNDRADNATANAANASNAAAPKTDYVAEIRAMAPPLRRATFLRAIRDADQPCQEVVSEREVDPVNGQASWAAACETGAAWVIIVEPDGNAKVTNAVVPKPQAG